MKIRSNDISTQCNMIANQLASANYLKDQSSESINAELTQLSSLYDGRVLVVDGSFKIVKDTYGLDTGKTMIAQEVLECFQGRKSTRYDSVNHYIEMTVPVMDTEGIETLGVILISVSTDSIVDSVEIFNRKALLLELLMGLIVIGIALYFSVSLVRPFKRVTNSIEEWSEGFSEETVSIPDYIETEAISVAFNKLLGKMKSLDASRQEFVSNVSHELKTPITSMKVLADSLLMQEEVPPELYKEFLGDITEEIDRETEIINDLLSLVKMDKTAANLNIQIVNINELIELILKRLRPIAGKRNIELVFESFREVSAEVDEVKLTLAFSNLVENAVKYNKENGWVHVSLNADHKYFYFKVADSGIGIPEEAIDQIFERFYRVDKSHSSEIGGTGLGLSITRSSILMHRGAIKVESSEGEGTTFTVRVPLNYIA